LCFNEKDDDQRRRHCLFSSRIKFFGTENLAANQFFAGRQRVVFCDGTALPIARQDASSTGETAVMPHGFQRVQSLVHRNEGPRTASTGNVFAQLRPGDQISSSGALSLRRALARHVAVHVSCGARNHLAAGDDAAANIMIAARAPFDPHWARHFALHDDDDDVSIDASSSSLGF